MAEEVKRKDRLKGRAMLGLINFKDYCPEEEMILGRIKRDSPEKNLHYAVLFDVLSRIMKEQSLDAFHLWDSEAKEAWEWLHSDLHMDHFISFMGVCEIFGFDPNQIRRNLRKFKWSKMKFARRQAPRRYTGRGRDVVSAR